jgi:hypothetical protein
MKNNKVNMQPLWQIKVVQLALNTSNGLALTGGTMKGNTFIPGVYFTRYGPNIDWGATLQIGGNGTRYIRTNLIASVVTTDGNLHIDAGSTKATYLNFYLRHWWYFVWKWCWCFKWC